jgi:hypothetical protein
LAIRFITPLADFLTDFFADFLAVFFATFFDALLVVFLLLLLLEPPIFFADDFFVVRFADFFAISFSLVDRNVDAVAPYYQILTSAGEKQRYL